jgi:hypothetical protein
MTEFTPPHVLLAEIEALQDEVLRQLDELNLRVERTLAEFGGVPVDPSAAVVSAENVVTAGRSRRSAA